jgi:hypothetical protein
MADALFGVEPPPAAAPPGWRARLELYARLQWTLYRDHPWLATLMSFTRPILAPNGMAYTEWAMRAVAGTGLDVETVFRTVVTVANYTRGTAVNLEWEADAEEDTGITDEQWQAAQGETLGAILSTGSFPMMSRIITNTDLDFDLDDLFEFGLARLLDGIEVLVDEHDHRATFRS